MIELDVPAGRVGAADDDADAGGRLDRLGDAPGMLLEAPVLPAGLDRRQQVLPQRLGALRPRRPHPGRVPVPPLQPRVVLPPEDPPVVSRQRGQRLVAGPHEEAVLVGDFDERHRRIVGVAELAGGVDAGEQVAGVLLLGGDQGRGEQAGDLVVRPQALGLGQFEVSAVGAPDVEIDVGADAPAGELVDEVVQPAQSLRREFCGLRRVPDAPRPGGRVHVMEAHAVDSRRRQPGRHDRRVVAGGKAGAEADVDSPGAESLPGSLEMGVLYGDARPVGSEGQAGGQCDEGLWVGASGNDEGDEVVVRRRRRATQRQDHRLREPHRLPPVPAGAPARRGGAGGRGPSPPTRSGTRRTPAPG